MKRRPVGRRWCLGDYVESCSGLAAADNEAEAGETGGEQAE